MSDMIGDVMSDKKYELHNKQDGYVEIFMGDQWGFVRKEELISAVDFETDQLCKVYRWYAYVWHEFDIFESGFRRVGRLTGYKTCDAALEAFVQFVEKEKNGE